MKGGVYVEIGEGERGEGSAGGKTHRMREARATVPDRRRRDVESPLIPSGITRVDAVSTTAMAEKKPLRRALVVAQMVRVSGINQSKRNFNAKQSHPSRRMNSV